MSSFVTLSSVVVMFASVVFGVIIGLRRKRLREMDGRQIQPVHWLVAGVFICFALFVVPIFKGGDTEDMLRDVFHISPDAPFVEVRYPRRGSANHIEGIVQFSEAEFGDYVSQLDDRHIWTADRFREHRHAVSGPYSPNALIWHPLPKPIFAGVSRVRWGNLSRRQVTGAVIGRALCVAFRRSPGKRKSDWWRPAPKGHEHRFPLETPSRLDGFNAVNCAELGRSERPVTYVLAVLDYESRKLHMIMR